MIGRLLGWASSPTILSFSPDDVSNNKACDWAVFNFGEKRDLHKATALYRFILPIVMAASHMYLFNKTSPFSQSVEEILEKTFNWVACLPIQWSEVKPSKRALMKATIRLKRWHGNSLPAADTRTVICNPVSPLVIREPDKSCACLPLPTISTIIFYDWMRGGGLWMTFAASVLFQLPRSTYIN